MSFELDAAFSLSIFFSVVIGWIRLRKTDPGFLPFLLYVSADLLNQAIGIVIGHKVYHNVVSYNLFGLAECLLLTWQFYRWGLFNDKTWLYYSVQVIVILGWLAEGFLTSFNSFNSYFIIAHSFLLVMMSIITINLVVLRQSTPLFKEPVFLLSIGLCLFFTYTILVEAFSIVGVNNQRTFRVKIYEIFSYINLFTNIVFAFAFLWIPMKPRSIMRSSSVL
jgi:hypothetical protein